MYRQITSHTNQFALTVSYVLEEVQNTHLQSPTYLFQSPSSQCGVPSWPSVNSASSSCSEVFNLLWFQAGLSPDPFWLVLLSGLEQIGSDFFSPKITDLVWPHTAQQNRSVNTLKSSFPNPWKYKYIQQRGTKQVRYRNHILYNYHLSHCTTAVHVGSWLSTLYNYDEWSAPSCQVKWWLYNEMAIAKNKTKILFSFKAKCQMEEKIWVDCGKEQPYDL